MPSGSEVILYFALARALTHDRHSHVWERAALGGGMELGTIAAFLVLEEKQHALKRGAKPFARLTSIESDHVKRTPGAVTDALERMWSRIASRIDTGKRGHDLRRDRRLSPHLRGARLSGNGTPILPCARPATHLGSWAGAAVPGQYRACSDGLAARATVSARDDPTGFERPMDKALRQVVVTSIGHWRGEGVALVEAVE